MTLSAQPVVDLDTGHTVHYELLPRMRDEHGDLIPPGTLVFVAERLGLITTLERAVACAAIRALADPAGPGHRALEVSLSTASIRDLGFIELVERELGEHGVDPGRMIFEISEDTALGCLTEALAFGERLARIGCRYSLDRFGARYGGFSHLEHMNLDLIKIADELVCGASDEDHSQLLIASIVAFAEQFGARTVAKGIRDATVLHHAAELGVAYGQGYHLGTPTPLALL